MGLKFGQTEKFKSIFRFAAVRYQNPNFFAKHWQSLFQLENLVKPKFKINTWNSSEQQGFTDFFGKILTIKRLPVLI